MKKFITIALAAMSLTSCFDNDDNNSQATQQWTYANCINAVTDLASNSTSITQQPKYTITTTTYSNGKVTAKISMSNIKLGDDIALTSFDLPEIEITANNDPNKPMLAEGNDIVPTNATASSIIFDYFKFKMLPRVIKDGNGQWQQSFVYSLNYSVNGRYVVAVIPTRSLLYGTTNVINETSGTAFTSTEPLYAITVDPEKMVATIDITGAKFLEQMPAMNMTFPNIPFNVYNGNLILNIDNLVPTIQGVEYPNYAISNLRANVNPCTAASLDFTCTANKMGAFNVHVDLVDILTGNNTTETQP